MHSFKSLAAQKVFHPKLETAFQSLRVYLRPHSAIATPSSFKQLFEIYNIKPMELHVVAKDLLNSRFGSLQQIGLLTYSVI